MSFLGELKRRNVVRVAGVYAVVGWLLVQISASLEEAVGLPPWFDGLVVSLLVIGFPIALIFAWAFELTPDGIKRTTAVADDESITAQTGSRLDAILVIALLLFAGSLVLPRFIGSDGTPVSVAGSAVAEASIAVLPFADLSPDGNQEYFADGISEELLNVLAQVSGMKVAGRTSSFAFKGRNEDLREIGRVLDVAHILEGSVRSQGDKVRVTAQLIQVSDGFHLWSETYDGDLTDIFAVQDDIAEQILVAMKTQLKVDVAPDIAPAARTDITAYGLFLEARDLIFSRRPENMEHALELLNRAIEIDPGYAPAYASRAKALALLSDRPGSYGKLPGEETLARADKDVQRALELDPSLADAYAVQGLINSDSGRLDFAISSLRRAIELNPNSLDARNWLALALASEGRYRDVAALLKALVDIDPLYRPGVNNTILYSEDIGDRETARQVGERYISAVNDEANKTLMRAQLLELDRQPAKAIQLRESVPEAAANSLVNASVRSVYTGLGVLEEYNGTATTLPVFEPLQRFPEGDFQGALEQARRAVEEAPDFYGAHTIYVRTLSQLHRDEELAAYFAEEYHKSLETFATRLRPGVNSDIPPYIELALALRTMGELELFTEAMRRFRFSLDIFRAGGDVSDERDRDEAIYWSVMGDSARALDFIELAYEKTAPLSIMNFVARPFESLKEEPRFIALRAKNIERINKERAILGFKPLTVAFYDRYSNIESSAP